MRAYNFLLALLVLSFGCSKEKDNPAPIDGGSYPQEYSYFGKANFTAPVSVNSSGQLSMLIPATDLDTNEIKADTGYTGLTQTRIIFETAVSGYMIKTVFDQEQNKPVLAKVPFTSQVIGDKYLLLPDSTWLRKPGSYFVIDRVIGEQVSLLPLNFTSHLTVSRGNRTLPETLRYMVEPNDTLTGLSYELLFTRN
ncbi:MAG: hypothetical protein V4616_08825 [Bacteroidota bacterium]